MRNCPQCQKPVDGLSCPYCGYSETGAKKTTAPDPFHLVCEHVFEGQRCAATGTLSEGLRGQGPWYCAAHFPLFAGRRYGMKPTAPPKGFDALKTVLEKKYSALILYERQPGEEG